MTVLSHSSLTRSLERAVRRGFVAASLAVALAAPAYAAAPTAKPAAAAETSHWVAAWAAAPQSVPQNPAAPSYNRAPQIERQTIRQVIYSRVAGQQARIVISNRYGKDPLVIARTRIAQSLPRAAIEADTDTAVTFHGKAEAVVPAGGELRSDPVAFKTRPGEAIAVSFYIDKTVAPLTWHKLASQVNYVSGRGDYSSEASGKSFPSRITSYLWLAGLEVDTGKRDDYAVAAIGDSITDGMRSTLNANRRWPDVLAQRLAGTSASVVNLGISGNRLLSDSPCYGERLVARFKPDALEQPAVRSAIILIGINDINFANMRPRAGLDCDFPHTQVSAATLIAGYERLIAEAHAKQVKLIAGTITPASLPPDREAIRTAVNKWIRESGKFDAVIDFDAALRDPQQPSRMLPKYDSDDHVHPNDAGYAEMGKLIPLDRLGPQTQTVRTR
jgi:lysophospholipase L1-like esterase